MNTTKHNIKAWFSALVSSFAGAFLGYLETPHSGLDGKRILMGALFAGAVAVLHLYQQPKIGE